MITLVRSVCYIACVWISQKYAGGYWVVGPVFGLTVALFDMTSPRRLAPKHVLFIALSTLLYSLVYGISRLEIGDDSVLFNYFIGSFPIAIVTGSVLLPIIHTRVFNRSRAGLSRAILALVGSFYLVEIFHILLDHATMSVYFIYYFLFFLISKRCIFDAF